MKTKLFRIAVATALAGLGHTVQAALPNGIAAGDVTQTSAVLWGRTDTAGFLKFEYATDKRFSRVIGSTIRKVDDAQIPAKWNVSDLKPGTTYYYRVTDSTKAVEIGSFKTPKALGTKSGLRFGVSGDWRGELLPYPAIQNADERGLDFFVSMGDTIYGDVASPANNFQGQAQTLPEYRNKHAEVYSELGGLNGLADLRKSTALFATIDDHEVTNDFAGGADVSTDARFAADPAGTLINDSTLFNNGLRAFQEYNPIRQLTYRTSGDARTDGETKLYRNQNFGSDAALMVLDARSFRDQELPSANPTDPSSIGAYLAGAFDPTRTLLGRRQVEDLKTDLLAAKRRHITWKFVMIPEPIQNLGVLGASDRYEGYAAERSEILKFIADNHIDNVVFVSADIHGTLVNNLTYQVAPFTPQLPTGAFEITTGSVAYDAPFGPTVLGLAAGIPVAPGVSLLDAFLANIGVPDLTVFNMLPDSMRNAAITGLIDQQIASLGYSPVGLQDSGLDVSLLAGGYAALNTYGWTEFEIDRLSQELLVTTYGITPYSANDIAADLAAITQRTPAIVSQFRLKPKIQN